MKGTIKSFGRDLLTGKNLITLEIDEEYSPEGLFGKVLDISLKIYRKKRSLNANAYAWELMDKISEKTGVRKNEVYREAIRNIGGVSDIMCLKDEAVGKFVRVWSDKGIGFMADAMGSGVLPGFTDVLVHYGSSTYDTAQMSRLINLLVDEAHEFGIATQNNDRIRSLLEGWKGK
jgi:hypothetical protein